MTKWQHDPSHTLYVQDGTQISIHLKITVFHRNLEWKPHEENYNQMNGKALLCSCLSWLRSFTQLPGMEILTDLFGSTSLLWQKIFRSTNPKYNFKSDFKYNATKYNLHYYAATICFVFVKMPLFLNTQNHWWGNLDLGWKSMHLITPVHPGVHQLRDQLP